jgi:hypothetical protein
MSKDESRFPLARSRYLRSERRHRRLRAVLLV